MKCREALERAFRVMRRGAARVAAAPPLHFAVRAIRPQPIFQIGFNKCGTTSIHQFLLASGIRSLHWEGGVLAVRMAARIAAGEDPIRDFPRAIGFTDTVAYRPGQIVEPYKRFEYLHSWYPNALFILNTRDRENWIASRSAHEVGGKTLDQIYAEILRMPQAQVPDFWRAEWDAHHRVVRAYFAGAANFLEFNVEQDDPRKLAGFISRRYPQSADTVFPLLNRSSSRETPR